MTEKDCLICKYDHPPFERQSYQEPCCSCNDCSNFEKYIPVPDTLQVLLDVKQYLLGVLEEWQNLPDDRKYEPANIQVYNHTRKELDDLEAYAERHGFKI